jgi:hypothetical protein
LRETKSANSCRTVKIWNSTFQVAII